MVRKLTSTTQSPIEKIVFGQTDCVLDDSTTTSTEITCTMIDEPVCGNWHPEIYSSKGLIPIASTVSKLSVDCTVSTMAPLTDLNVLGYDNLTISGTNFPRYLQDNTIEIEFDNTAKSKCIP